MPLIYKNLYTCPECFTLMNKLKCESTGKQCRWSYMYMAWKCICVPCLKLTPLFPPGQRHCNPFLTQTSALTVSGQYDHYHNWICGSGFQTTPGFFDVVCRDCHIMIRYLIVAYVFVRQQKCMNLCKHIHTETEEAKWDKTLVFLEKRSGAHWLWLWRAPACRVGYNSELKNDILCKFGDNVIFFVACWWVILSHNGTCAHMS